MTAPTAASATHFKLDGNLARLSTKPLPTGSATCTNIVGTVCVARCKAANIGLLKT